MAWLTMLVTRPVAADPVPDRGSRWRTGARLAVVLAVTLVTAAGHGAVPVWSALVARFHGLGEATLSATWFGGPGNAVADPFQCFLVPLLLLMMLGARPEQLGLGSGHRVGRSSVVWIALPVVLLGGLLIAGVVGAQVLARQIIANALQSG